MVGGLGGDLQHDRRILEVEPSGGFGGFADGRPFGVARCQVVEVDVLGVVGFLVVGCWWRGLGHGLGLFAARWGGGCCG